jgi:hypothetical protein
MKRARSISRSLLTRLARIAVMCVMCLPALVVSNRMMLYEHVQQSALALAVCGLALAFWANERLLPLSRKR